MTALKPAPGDHASLAARLTRSDARAGASVVVCSTTQRSRRPTVAHRNVRARRAGWKLLDAFVSACLLQNRHVCGDAS